MICVRRVLDRMQQQVGPCTSYWKERPALRTHLDSETMFSISAPLLFTQAMLGAVQALDVILAAIYGLQLSLASTFSGESASHLASVMGTVDRRLDCDTPRASINRAISP